MKTPPAQLLHKMLYILHEGLSDLRYMARDGKGQQACDLADTLENIPGFLANWEDHYLEQIRTQLEHYQAKYKDASWHNYARYLGDESPPDRF
jgi:hypothetical protein